MRSSMSIDKLMPRRIGVVSYPTVTRSKFSTGGASWAGAGKLNRVGAASTTDSICGSFSSALILCVSMP